MSAGGLGSGSGKAVAKQKCKKLSFQTFHGFVCHQQIAKPKDQSIPAKMEPSSIKHDDEVTLRNCEGILDMPHMV